jgi:hypothetical protein
MLVLVVGRFEKALLSSDECPSDKPLVTGGFIERSFSDIVRASNGDCCEFIDGSRELVDDKSRGMFEFVKGNPEPEYDDDGIVVPLANVTVDAVVVDGGKLI